MAGKQACEKGCMKSLTEKLGLTEEQASRIDAIRSEYLEETTGLKAEIRAKKAAASERFRDPEASDKEIRKAQEEVASLKAKKKEAALKYRLQARAVLNPDQIRNLPEGCSLGIGCRCAGGGCGKACAGCKGCPHAGAGGYHGKGGMHGGEGAGAPAKCPRTGGQQGI